MEIILFISGLAIGCAIAIIFAIKTNKLQEQIQELLIYKGRFEQAGITIADLKLQNQNQQKMLSCKAK